MPVDKAVDLYRLLNEGNGQPQQGLKIIKVNTTEPDPITFIFEGKEQPLDLAVFEIPVSLYPLKLGDRLLAYPLIGGVSQRWAALEKLNGGVTMATMQSATSLKVEGVGKVYGASDLLIPPYFLVGDENTRYVDNDIDVHCSGGDSGTSTDHHTSYSDYYLLAGNSKGLQAGDVVSIAPTWDAATKKIKYAILERY